MSGKQCHPDQTPRSAAFDLDLHCLLRPACFSNTQPHVLLQYIVKKTGAFRVFIRRRFLVNCQNSAIIESYFNLYIFIKY